MRFVAAATPLIRDGHGIYHLNGDREPLVFVSNGAGKTADAIVLIANLSEPLIAVAELAEEFSKARGIGYGQAATWIAEFELKIAALRSACEAGGVK